MYSREEVKAITDKVLDMAAKGTDAEVDFSGGERSATRFANSTITANMVQFDRQVSVTVYQGTKSGTASTRQFDDASLREMVDEALAAAGKGRDNPEMQPLVGPQEYEPVDAALPAGIAFGPAERAKLARQSIDISDKMQTVGSGYIPKIHQTTCRANSKGLFAYYQVAETSFILTCRTVDGTGSGWAGITGVKDPALIDAEELTRIASGKAVRSRNAKAIEPGRYTVILEPRANARFLSLMTGLFNAQSAESPFTRTYFSGKEPGSTKLGEQVFSEGLTLRSDIGNPILRQVPFAPDGTALRDVTWVEKGVLKNLVYSGAYARRQKQPVTPASLNNSLVWEGTTQSIDDIVKSTRRGLLVTFFWYIRGVDNQTLLNTGMTRDGLFLIENGEIAGPVQNFRWNMSPIVGYNNITAVGKPVPIHTGESYDGPGTALVPPVRIEDFLMTSVSPAV
ncbi:MAG TPA: TldD/PmbA family protein [Vicinamibacterales bacterium]|nr:TldD/PmbA family protein [Vicinamibacterales bacterium]